MADAVACWLNGGWDLSFLDPDSVRFEELEIGDQQEHTNSTGWSNSGNCRKRNSLALIVRRRIHSYCEISPIPLDLSELPLTLDGTKGRTDQEQENINSTGPHTKKTHESPPTSNPVYQHPSTNRGTDSGHHGPPTLPPRIPLSPSSVRLRSRECPSIKLSHAPETEDSSMSSWPSSSPSGLLRPEAAFCRFSASPAADDSSAFSYKDTEDNVPRSKPDLCQWRGTRCFAAWDEELLTRTFHRLSVCGFYFGRLSFDEAKRLLRRSSVGTFLLRNSSDERFPFSLSVQTTRGTTSIRIIYESGLFRLDSDPDQVHLMPTFDCVLGLIQFYVHQRLNGSGQSNFVLLQVNGQRDIPVLLRWPYQSTPSALSHLCRKRINRNLGNSSVNRLQLLPSLKAFLNNYPYDI